MKFKPGDLVRPINTHDKDPRLWWLNDSLIGEITGWARAAPRLYWPVKFHHHNCCCDENSLVLVPSDPQGRQVIEWDWTELKSPVLA
ncbi:MAG: hypothetical protein M3O26_15625 [Pseudomonadota bacterium]|nr:hypothetical protein [Pseudomonadota bacterium]